MASKHTPGPWTVLDEIPAPSVVSPDGTDIAYLGCYCYPTEGVSEHVRLANARLMAAAPELLEATKELLALFEAIEGDEHGDEPEFVQAHAAIAKAEGR